MHIAFLNPQGNFDPNDSHLTEHPDFGGQLVYVKEVARSMAAMGHQVDILTRRMQDPEWPEFADPIDGYPGNGANLRIVRLECGGPLFLKKERLWPHMAEFVDQVRQFYKAAMPDFATAHYADGGYCAALLEHAEGVRFTFTGHSLGAQKIDKLGMTQTNADALEERFRFSRRIAAERLSMQRAYRIITSTKQERREQYAHPLYNGVIDVGADNRFEVIPPGVNTQIFAAEAGKLDAELGQSLLKEIMHAARPFVIVSNRLDEKKNTLGVVQAFAKSDALRSRADLLLCFRGIDNPFAELSRLDKAERDVLTPILQTIEKAGLRTNVRFLNIPSQQALAATYRAVASGGGVFALTAFYEPFGLAPIEAAACGLACVATRNGGPSDIFNNGSGILVDPSSPADIASGLITALDSQPKLAERARNRVLNTYTWQRTANRYLKVIEEGIAAPYETMPDVAALDASGHIVNYLAAR